MMVQFSRGCCGHPEAPIPPLSHSLPFQLHSCFHHPYRVHQGICDKGWKNTTTSAAEARPLYCHELTPCAVRHFQKPHRCTASNFMLKFRRHQPMDSSFLHLFYHVCHAPKGCCRQDPCLTGWIWNSSSKETRGDTNLNWTRAPQGCRWCHWAAH